MDLSKLNEVLKDEPKYRYKQVNDAIFKNLIDNWDNAATFPASLREALSKNCSLEVKHELLISRDNRTMKALIILNDGAKIETVLMMHKEDRNTVCVSSQVGCPMGCTFCATGKMGFKRNLTSSEIVDQVLLFARLLKKENKKITNVVVMGMGEPFLNYDNVLSAIKTLNEKTGFNLGARHFSISTCGVIEGIKRLAAEKMEINLAISLHAPNDELREKIMPSNKKYSIKKILDAVDDYFNRTHRKVMFEYILLKNVNDGTKHAVELANLLQGRVCVVNLIPYNPTGKFEATSSFQIQKFKALLEAKRIDCIQRFSYGQDIMAACGQLATKN